MDKKWTSFTSKATVDSRGPLVCLQSEGKSVGKCPWPQGHIDLQCLGNVTEARPRQGPGDVVAAVLEGSQGEQEAKSHAEARNLTQVMGSPQAGLKFAAEGVRHRRTDTFRNPTRVKFKTRRS